jgi:hypothetical protein
LVNAFATELEYIKTPEIRVIADKILENVPEYFYSIAASSTGKYHPSYALGEGGLYRHVRAAIKIARHMFAVQSTPWSQVEQDLIIVSLMFHDGWKQGEDPAGNTIHEHPLVAADKILTILNPDDGYNMDYVFSICNNIASHMGQWTTSNYSKTSLPKPDTDMEKLVHLIDYLASRKDIEILF